MKCQMVFSGKNKKHIINVSSAELAQRVVEAKSSYGSNASVKKTNIHLNSCLASPELILILSSFSKLAVQLNSFSSKREREREREKETERKTEREIEKSPAFTAENALL